MKIYGLKIFYYVKFMESHTRFILCGLNESKEKITIELDKDKLKINRVSSFDGFSLISKDLSSLQIPEILDEELSKNIIDNEKESYDSMVIEESYNGKYNILRKLEKLLSLNKDYYYRYILSNIHFFSKTCKYKDRRPVWFFKGSHVKAKNSIANKTNISKYIIDKYNFVPDLIECDIIVFPDNMEENLESSLLLSSIEQRPTITNDLIKSKCIGSNEYISVSFERKINNNIKYPFRKRRHVYIFMGEPNIGKSYIGNSLGVNIFETDKNPILPQYIEEDIIIIGKNRIYDIDLDIVPRFKGNCYFTYVEFNYIN